MLMSCVLSFLCRVFVFCFSHVVIVVLCVCRVCLSCFVVLSAPVIGVVIFVIIRSAGPGFCCWPMRWPSPETEA